MRRSFDRSRVDMMRAYAETDDCRRAFILSYFGEPFEPPCGRCDNCEAGRVHAPPADVPFPVGARVAHGSWGEGVVQRYDDDIDGRPVRRRGLQDARAGGRPRARGPQAHPVKRGESFAAAAQPLTRVVSVLVVLSVKLTLATKLWEPGSS